ncbi:TIR domain-containing protein [Atlantibacter hermannii]|uniref:TIR domain-containing protein n=1 Tax=Atlantibacter hermannii TaxID=565 RepID=UPI0028A7839F|nr:TIR domain-containing protein [Atlantibacter hermannii]
MSIDKPLVFISYASQDKERVLSYYDALEDNSYKLWMDCKKLIGGQDWDFEIRKNFSKADVVIAFITSNSYKKRGYVQRELKLALKNLEEKLRDDIYLIPVLFDGVSVPEELKHIHCIYDKGEQENINNLKIGIRSKLKNTNDEFTLNLESGDISYRLENHKESREGLPGYEVNNQFINLTSKTYKNLGDLSLAINSDLTKITLNYRKSLLEQDSSLFNYADQYFLRTNTIESNCTVVNIVGRVISILYSHYYICAKAAHGNIYFSSYNFILDLPTAINSLEEIFINPEKSLLKLQEKLTQNLITTIYEGEISDDLMIWLKNGIRDWESLSNFIFQDDGLTIYFSPYAVAGYAYGPQEVKIPYDEIYEDIKKIYISFLDIPMPN